MVRIFVFIVVAFLGLTGIRQFSNDKGSDIGYEGYVYFTTKLSPNLDSIEPQKMMPTERLTLYKHYLIEDAIQMNHINGNYIGTDTLGYYFVDLRKQIYTKYDTLSVNAKELEQGELHKKREGISFYYSDSASVSALSIRDTVIDNEGCKIATAIKKDKLGTFQYKAWIKPSPPDFPIQLSPFISDKAGGGFVWKAFYSTAGQNSAFVGEIRYEERKLPENIKHVMEIWGARLREE